MGLITSQFAWSNIAGILLHFLLPKFPNLHSVVWKFTSPDAWKMDNIVPIQKKEAKYLVKNNRHTNTTSKSFANISQGFWKTLFNFLFSHFNNANLFTKCKSGFMPVDSCISQLHRLIASHPLLLEQYSCGSRVYCFN